MSKFTIQTFPPEDAEIPPTTGKPYLVLGSALTADNSVYIQKLVDPTPENLAIVRAAIESRGTVTKVNALDRPITSVQSVPATPATNGTQTSPPPAAVKAADVTPEVAIEKPPRNAWSLWLVAIVAAIGLILLLLRATRSRGADR